MNKKNILALILSACLITLVLIFSVNIMIDLGTRADANQNQSFTTEEISYNKDGNDTNLNNSASNNKDLSGPLIDITETEPWLLTNPDDMGFDNQAYANVIDEDTATKNTLGGALLPAPDLSLILDSDEVDYMAYIPIMQYDSQIEAALDIENPDISINAKSAILIDVNSKQVLYHKKAVEPTFPASTAKLLSALVTLDWCELDEEITVGDEIKMIPSDSSIAHLKIGQILTTEILLNAMLLPSGNDASYVAAVYVGRKSLDNQSADKLDAVLEFTRLMNEKAKVLGVKNSCFKTPDGYDALGQYTTAYDMALIGVAAVENEIIKEICSQGKARSILPSGQDITWYNTNSLIKNSSGNYYPYATGLKTGTSTMAGKCLIASGEKDGKEVLCVILYSTTHGRWQDARKLLDYGLQ